MSIKKILPSDILADSRNKINDNFEILANEYELSSYSIAAFKKEINGIIELLSSQLEDLRESGVGTGVGSYKNSIEYIYHTSSVEDDSLLVNFLFICNTLL